MDGDAIPFLTACDTARPSVLDRVCSLLLKSIPSQLSRGLPSPHDALYYAHRRDYALGLLGNIGSSQRFRTAAGEPLSKQSIHLAIPAIGAALRDTNNMSPVFAAQAAWFIGPPAKPLVPDLMALVARPDVAAAAIQAFGAIGRAVTLFRCSPGLLPTPTIHSDCMLCSRLAGSEHQLNPQCRSWLACSANLMTRCGLKLHAHWPR